MKTCRKCGIRRYDASFLIPTARICAECHGKRRDARRVANPAEYRTRRGVWAATARRYHRFTPKWADLGAIARFYEGCPTGLEVDHVVPLHGEAVTGLHVLANLQYLAPKANREKANNFQPGPNKMR